MEMRTSNTLPVHITWENGVLDTMEKAGFNVKDWPRKLDKLNRNWCHRWNAGRCIRINRKSLKRKENPERFGMSQDICGKDDDSWQYNARDFSEIAWVQDEWKIQPNLTGRPAIYDEWDDLFQEEVIVDRQVIGNIRYPREKHELSMSDLDTQAHRVGDTSEQQVCTVDFGTHCPTGDAVLERYRLMDEASLKPASLYEGIAYVAKYFDQHIGQILIPLAGWSQKLYAYHVGIPMFICSKQGVTASWREHSGGGWNDKVRFMATLK